MTPRQRQICRSAVLRLDHSRAAKQDSAVLEYLIHALASDLETELRTVPRFIRNRHMLFGFDFLENLSKCADLDFAQEKEGAVNRKEISWSRVQPERVLLRSICI